MVAKRLIVIAAAMLLATVGNASGTAPTADVPTAEDFGALPFLSTPVLAPNGSRLAARTQEDGKTRLVIVDVSTDKTDKNAQSMIALPDGTDLLSYRWASNSVLLIDVSMPPMPAPTARASSPRRGGSGAIAKDLAKRAWHFPSRAPYCPWR